MAPDTRQNLIYTIYFIILHNWEAILYSLGIVLMTLWALYRPSRGKIIIMWGFIALLFAFEYNKHILEPLREQTRNSLITERQSHRIGYVVDKVTTRLIPRGLPLAGWLAVIVGATLEVKAFKKKSPVPSAHNS